MVDGQASPCDDGLIAAGAAGWTAPRVLLALAGGGGSLVAFLRWEARHPSPMMPPALFRIPAFSGANLMTLLLYAVLSGALFFLPFNLMQVQGYSATEAGAAFLPFTMLVGGLSRWAGGLAARVRACHLWAGRWWRGSASRSWRDRTWGARTGRPTFPAWR
jgi:hypothetical protein